jgi:hypothetical protein
MREKMKTIGGMSVRAEIEMRLEDARTAAIEEVITFLGGSGHFTAAEDLQRAAFSQEPEKANG